MLGAEKGVLPGSDYYLMTQSAMAQEIFFYPLYCGHFRCINGYDIQRNDYHNYLLMYVARGKCEVETEGVTYEAEAGDLIILNCHKPHRYTAIDYLDIVWLHFDGHDAETFYREIVRRSGVVIPIGEESEITATIQEILMLYRNNQRLGEAEFSWKIYRILCQLLVSQADAISPSQHNSVNHATRFIEDNLGKPIQLADIAAHVNMSVFHFARLFKKKVGQSPYHYLLIARIDRAKMLLKSSDLPVKEIAREVGFNSETNFISAFSGKVGIPPQRFREFPL
jgi:AraC-like DNA-binding protein